LKPLTESPLMAVIDGCSERLGIHVLAVGSVEGVPPWSRISFFSIMPL
jgi:hypothetical protein